MPTKNAINSAAPIEIAVGGTGAATLTDHGVLVGSGTGAITALTVGSTGELLIGATGADPAFGTSATGNFTFGGAVSGSERVLYVTNTSNTANSGAKLRATVGGSSAKDPYVHFTVTGSTDWTMGVDNSDSDAFVISANSALGTTNVMRVSSNGEITMPLQSAFLAYNSSSDTNVTGNGTVYTVEFDTEVFDQNGDYDNATDTFTAPVTGRYMFEASVILGDITAADDCEVRGVTSNRTFVMGNVSPVDVKTATGYVGIAITFFADMDAADTCYIAIVSSGEAGDINKVYGSVNAETFFSGQLIC